MISFQQFGKGQPLLFLHGFPMNKKVWEHFGKKLSEKFQVILVDLPGFGESPALPGPFSIDDVAREIISFIKSQNIERPVLIGHSLGGYVALGMIKNAKELFSGLILFHSTAYPDSEEKKQSRNKVLEFIRKNGVLPFTSNFIAPLFASPHPAIEKVKSIAIESSEETVIGYTKAMRDRPDHSPVLREFTEPVLFIGGETDPGISVDSLRKQAALTPKASLQILDHTGHMGMFEKEEITLKTIESFLKKNTVTN